MTKTITLNKPDFNSNDMSVIKALQNRKSSRMFASTPLSTQELSEILWAAWGINREDKRRTAPSAKNVQNITLYAVLENGAYKYIPENNTLEMVAEGDFRADMGVQDFVGTAPLNIIFVASPIVIDGARIPREDEIAYSHITVGGISENIYLYCTMTNLATVARASVPKTRAAQILNLPEEDEVLYGQTVGHHV